MNYKVGDFLRAIDKIAPFCATDGKDNVGLLVGGENESVNLALFALDITSNVIDEAVKIGANLIITHHPVIFYPIMRLSPDDRAYKLAVAGISVICAHTNLDMAAGGVNDTLAGLLELKRIKKFCKSENPAPDLYIGRAGELENPMSPKAFALYVKEKLNLSGLYYTAGKRDIKTVAICSGDGSSFFGQAVRDGVDAYVTGESRHHVLLEAAEAGITYIAAGHFATENIVLEPLMTALAVALPGAELKKSQANTDIVNFI